ncbi:MAG TPA: Rrf2 family transcriptional regulator [Candidatus Marinimicrobia bacterium]|nr:MAG: hypothetical protein AUJ47_06380 [Candidatus Marinimicrobia bacterium CG1_02_48_14]PJA54451.1 MAG: Rrf2 family transcriptional regulator [Candidatus Marinimicrobia bacterium CG_4_9_14_3_um_filter_48_9]HCW77016.1 Rrf2 family transcriptional regulator [Candidatus Neomarinimicrobiota bacterium]
MIQVTKAGEYGLRALAYLVNQGPGVKVSIAEISQARQIPEPYLRKLLKPLIQKGILVSIRGVAGGVMVGRPLEEITFLEVIEALEGPINLNTCLVHNETCQFIGDCGMHPVWIEAQEAMFKILGGKTLNALLDPH